jgi:hypothetical protein
MANSLPTFGVLSTDEFLPALRQRCQKLSTFSTDFSSLVATKGTVANVPLQSVTTASQWNSTDKYTSADETITTVDVTLEEPLYKEFYLSPNEQASYSKEFLLPRMEAAINSVLDEVERKAYAALITSQTTLASISSSNVLFGAVQSGSNVLITSGSQGAISLFAPVAQYSVLQSDAKASGYGMWDVVSKGGDSFQYGDVTVRRTPKLSGRVVFATPDAVALALRLPPLMNGYVRTIVIDEPTGVAIAVDLIEDAVGGVIRGRAHISPGVKRARTGSSCQYTIA